MKTKLTNIGVQLMPLILAIASVAYYVLAAYIFCVTCFVMALVMWLLLWAENKGL